MISGSLIIFVVVATILSFVDLGYVAKNITRINEAPIIESRFTFYILILVDYNVV